MSLSFTRLPLLGFIAITLGMLLSLSWQGYDLWQSNRFQGSEVATQVSDKAAASPKVPDISLAALDLFGKPGQEAAPETEDTKNLPETNLQLYLRGVMAANGDYPASALVEDSKSKTEAYQVGEDLPGNATLHSVHPRRVIIARGGKLENLYFPETEASGEFQVADNRDSRPQANTSAASSRPASNEPMQREAAQPSDARREEIRNRLQQLRTRLRNSGN